MRIQHNIMAMNAYRNYSNNTSALAKNLEKLSSGYKINRAGDDAAGLAISEKMRAQITGLEAAQKNVKDGISLVNTAEGAMQEVQDMLNRMVYLAQESANGTFDNEVDRKALQQEVDQLREEIDRIADSANFNGIKLLDGSLSDEGGASTASVEGGGKVAYIEGLDAVQTVATKDEFVASAKMQVAANKTALITYQGADGKTYTKSLAAGTAAATLTDLIDADAELSQLFTTDGSTGTKVISRIAGAQAPRILSIAVDSTAPDAVVAKAATSVTGRDAGVMVSFGTAGASAPAAGDTVTIGDKTYEFVNTVGKAKKGNIEVKFTAASLAGAITALADALQKNGVTSATVFKDTKVVSNNTVTNALGVFISDPDQIAIDAKGPAVAVDAASGSVYAQGATKNEYTLADIKNTGTKDVMQELTVSIIDENGEAKDIKVNYVSASSAASNEANIKSALENSAEISKYFDVGGSTGAYTLTSKAYGSKGAQLAGIKTSDSANNYKFDFTTTNVGEDAKKTLALSNVGAGSTVTVNGQVYEFVNEGQAAADGHIAVTVGKGGANPSDDDNTSAKNLADVLKNNGINVSRDKNKLIFSNEGGSAAGEGGLMLQIGDSSDEYNQLRVSVKDMHVKAMGIGSIDISTQAGAQAAVDVIKDSINYVSEVRGRLGAISNRLDHTANNLSVMRENIQDAESAIRDTDVADEMMAYTKNNILVQSAQAMLAQANQVPQGVLQLLQ